MKFQLPFFKKTKEEDSLFLGLFLKEDEGTIFYIQKRFQKLTIIASEEFTFSSSWEKLTEDVDDVLYRMERQTRKAPDKTIFFVYSHLIDERTAQIKRPFLDKIKTLVKNLDLKPLGYIDTHEAVVEGIAAKEDIPLTAILIELGSTNLQLFVYKGGKAIVAKHVARSNDLLDDIIPTLEEVRSSTVLPSRIIMYNSSDLNKEAGAIINHHWKEDFFIQMPKVEVLDSSSLHDYLMKVFLTQLSSEAPSPAVEEEDKAPADNVMGFVIGGEVEEEKETTSHAGTHEDAPAPRFSSREEPVPGKTFDLASYIGSLKSSVAPFLDKIKSMPALPLIGALLILFALFCMEYFFHKADVVVLLPSKAVEKSVVVTSEVDKKSGEDVPVRSASTDLTITDSKTTTGQKEIGKKAHGEVTLHNFSDEEKTFTKNTQLTTDNLKFILIEDVKVASSSLAADGSAKLPGKKKGSVEGGEIGEEYNLPKGKRFTIGDLSKATYFGVNEADLTGGSKRKIQTVSAEDVAAIRASILKKTDAELAKKLEGAKNRKEVIIRALTEKEISSLTSSAEVGEEAGQVDVKAAVTATYYFFKDDALKTHLAKSLSPSAPQKYTIRKERVFYKIESAKKNKSSVTLKIDAKAKATSEVNTKGILGSLRGRRASELIEIVKDKYEAQGVEYEIHHPLPPLTGFMPIFKKNIELKIEYP